VADLGKTTICGRPPDQQRNREADKISDINSTHPSTLHLEIQRGQNSSFSSSPSFLAAERRWRTRRRNRYGPLQKASPVLPSKPSPQFPQNWDILQLSSSTATSSESVPQTHEGISAIELGVTDTKSAESHELVDFNLLKAHEESDLLVSKPKHSSLPILLWNVRRSSSSNFFIFLLNIIREDHPLILSLIEAPSPDHTGRLIQDTCGFSNFKFVDPMCRRGGIWYFWKHPVSTIDFISTEPSLFHCLLTMAPEEPEVMITAMHAPSASSQCQHF